MKLLPKALLIGFCIGFSLGFALEYQLYRIGLS